MTAWRSQMGRTQGWLGNRWCGEGWIRSSARRLRKALLDYCGKDTLALVRLLEILHLHCSN